MTSYSAIFNGVPSLKIIKYKYLWEAQTGICETSALKRAN